MSEKQISFSISAGEPTDADFKAVAKRYAGNEMKRLNALANKHGLSVNAIIREYHEGDWDDMERAAEHLASDRRWFVRLWNWIERQLG